jgi:hypothetical protein
MTAVLRQHVPHAQASILAGALRSAGFHADVWGEQAAHLYGEMAVGGCSLVVKEDEYEDAEAYLAATPQEPPPELAEASETGPSDGDPPGVAVLLYCGLWLAFGLTAVLTITSGSYMIIEGFYRTGVLVIPVKMLLLSFFSVFVLLGLHFACVAAGAGTLLRIIQGYRAGSKTCRFVVQLVVALMIAACWFGGTGG